MTLILYNEHPLDVGSQKIINPLFRSAKYIENSSENEKLSNGWSQYNKTS